MESNAAPFSDTLVERLANARRVGVLTGAGVSAESGISTFRDAGGLWSKFKPGELANVEAFLNNPDLVQRWYQERRQISGAAQPNPGHYALAALEKEIPEFVLVTQNVDGLHARAGSQTIIELHGNIERNYCIDCLKSVAALDEIKEGQPAVCENCGGFVRPDVVWFGERLPATLLETAMGFATRADVFLSVGTSSVVYPAAELPLIARDYGAYVAEINREKTEIGHMLNETVLGSSGIVLPQLLEAVISLRKS